jgi:hypothetical protein
MNVVSMRNNPGSAKLANGMPVSKAAFLSSNVAMISTAVLNQGEDGFQRWVGWDMIAHNLKKIGSTVAARSG